MSTGSSSRSQPSPVAIRTPDAVTPPAPSAAALPEDALLGVSEALQTVRQYLDMDVAFVSEFIGDHRYIRYLDARQERPPLQVGDALPLAEGYCDKVVRGTCPGVIADAAAHPACREAGIPAGLRIGSQLSVPLRRADGSLYGTFCCFNHEADASLNDRDLRLLQMFASLVARRLQADARQDAERGAKAARIGAMLASHEPAIVYQPVFRLRDGELLGAEALARFTAPPGRTPDLWFAEAAEVGLQTELELQAIRNAVAGYRAVWAARHDMRLAFNASPATLLDAAAQRALHVLPLERAALEITEHDRVEDYARLGAALAPLRQRGCRITVDDAGSGYASLRHILQIEPDVIKLDISLTRGIDASAGKRALAGGLIEFARQTGCEIIAEGVETAAELATLRALRVNSAQGYLLGRPAPADDLQRRLAEGGRPDEPLWPVAAAASAP